MGPRVARCSVSSLDVVQAPLDLNHRIGFPVRSELLHLDTRLRLRNTVGRIVPRTSCRGSPAALLGPKLFQARELARGKARPAEQRAADLAVTGERLAVG